jgi:hypothetical protein
MVISDIVRSANVVAFLVGGGGVDDLLAQTIRNKTKPKKMQNKTPQIVSMILIMIITVFFDILDGFALGFGFDSTKPHFSVRSIKIP